MGRQQIDEPDLSAELEKLRRRVQFLEAELAGHERTRRALREEHSFRKAVIERAAEGVCVCHDIPEYPNVLFTIWNRRMTEITGYRIEEINRLGWYQTVYADAEVQDRARQRMERMRRGEDLRNERWEIVRADGQRRVLGISSSVLTTDEGATHVLALMQDVTEVELFHRHLEARLETLQKLLPICASCKKIRDGEGDWHEVEIYVGKRFDADFTHGICPDCAQRLRSDADLPIK